MPNVMILAHGHPELSHGGAEVAAKGIHSRVFGHHVGDWTSVIIARSERKNIGHDGDFGAFRGRADEILACPPDVDGFFYQSFDRSRLFKLLEELTSRFKPDIVHAHHFAYWGLDTIDYFSERGIPLVLTLHEYLSICNHFGQMVKTNGRLCYRSSPAECHSCFPETTSGMFFLRDRIFKDHFSRVTHLVSPSNFLARRIDEWAEGKLRISVIENPRDAGSYHPASISSGSRTHRDSDEPAIVGYFGQLNKFKGTELLLEAMRMLQRRGERVRLRLFGANLNDQDAGFRERILRDLAELASVVEFFGPYENEAVVRLMSQCDAVVIPSIWWENSPVVIQEAIQAGVRVIASRLGGIEEKLSTYPRCIFFEPGSALDLAEKILSLSRDRSGHSSKRNTASVQDPMPVLLRLYQSCLSELQAVKVAPARGSRRGRRETRLGEL